jgi:hypothetical protein
VTGIDVKDFDLLVSLGVFNDTLMNDAVWKFRRYEDASLSYTGIDKHEGEAVGGFDTVISEKEYKKLYGSQQKSMVDDSGGLYTFSIEDDDDEEPRAELHGKLSTKGSMKTVSKSRAVKMNNQQNPFEKKKVTFKKIGSKLGEQKMDLSGIKIGSKVMHDKFGEGTVVAFPDDRVTVTFGDKEKVLMFPETFESGILRSV